MSHLGIGNASAAPTVRFILETQAVEPLRVEMVSLRAMIERLVAHKQGVLVSIATLDDASLRLRLPIPAEIFAEHVEVMARSTDLEVYGVGETEFEALSDLRRAIVDEYRFLVTNESDLGPHPKRLLGRFRQLIVEVSA